MTLDTFTEVVMVWPATSNWLIAGLWLQLLEEGADLHAIAPKRATGGSPLAEAVAGKHEALVELLLRYGADPFTENSAGDKGLHWLGIANYQTQQHYAVNLASSPA